jgi:HK97 family phage major capsid protein
VADIRRGNDQRLKDLTTPANQLPHHNGGDPEDRKSFKSIGEEVLGNERFMDYLKNLTANGRVPSREQIQTPRVEVKTLLTGSSATSAGPLVNIDYKPILDRMYERPLTVIDLITKGETSGDTVEFARITGVTNNAAPVAEATATGDGTGVKPESAMALEAVTETVKTIAHWIPALRAGRGVGRSGVDGQWRGSELHRHPQHHRHDNAGVGYQRADHDP